MTARMKSGVLQQLSKWPSLFGDCGLREKVESNNSTLTADPHGHLYSRKYTRPEIHR